MAEVDISVDVGALLGVSLDALSPSAAEAVEDLLEQVRGDWDEALLAYWPIDTGFSLRMWESTVEGLRLILRNAVDYSEFVHPSGETVGAGVEHMRDVRDRLLGAALPAMRAIIRADGGTVGLRPTATRATADVFFSSFVEAMGRRSGSVRRLEAPRLLTRSLVR